MEKKKYTTPSEWQHAQHVRLRDEIIDSGYTYEGLAYYLGYESKGTISKWTSYTHDTVPEISTIVAIANLLDVSVEYLLCITDERKPFHHDEPIDWTVIEDRSPRKRSASDLHSLLKKLDRKNYLRFHRSKAGRSLFNMKKSMTIRDYFKTDNKTD